MHTVIAPEVDMLTVSKSSRFQRRAILGFAPKIGLSIVDYGDLEAIDNFYLECQNYRDYYHDPYNKLRRPEMFNQHHGRCGVKLDRSVDLLRRPVKYLVEPKPVVYPIDYARDMRLGQNLTLQGRYSPNSCMSYKR